jgi:membrane protein YdbS with pleckstrin-like domain
MHRGMSTGIGWHGRRGRMMNKCDPEMLTFILVTIKNIMLIGAAAVTTIALFYFSRSWWSLLALVMLFGLSSGSFTRD